MNNKKLDCKKLRLMRLLPISLIIIGGSSIFSSQATASASIRVTKIKQIPKAFRGTWYTQYDGKTKKIRVTAKHFSKSTYRAKYRLTRSQRSEKYFTPYRVHGKHVKKSIIYLMNGRGMQTVRRMKHNGKPELIIYSEQTKRYTFSILTKKKSSKLNRMTSIANPGGNGLLKKQALQKNISNFRKLNVSVKKYLSNSVSKKVDEGGSVALFKTKIVYYSAFDYWVQLNRFAIK